jgi:protein phosphatase
MNAPHPQIYCPNLNCSAPLNDVGNTLCANCQTPLVYRYLWATGIGIEQVPVASMVGGRYYVKTPQIWLDTQPALQSEFPTADLPETILPYLYLYAYQLHVPEVYGVCASLGASAVGASAVGASAVGEPEVGALAVGAPETGPESGQAAGALGATGQDANTPNGLDILLLENAALDAQGNLYPAIAQAWPQATAVRQGYWLWQLLQLWGPFAEQGVSASLLAAENIRVEGWRIRLCQLFQDEGVLQTMEEGVPETPTLGLADLANVWLEWVNQANPTIAASLESICHAMQVPNAQMSEIAQRLNHLLLEQAAQLPLQLHLTGASDVGPNHEHNEDTCYPSHDHDSLLRDDGVFPRLAVVCDGIGGHEGGEIASQMAVQSLKLQIQALLTEVASQNEPFTPEVVAEQLEAIARVINDLISHQNNLQGREARRRMGTTLVMALQLPQRIPLPNGTRGNSHELYLLNVGDSRAYWITPHYCQRLTVDDDVAVREVRMGRLPYRQALRRPDAGALTQAIGTRDSEYLRPMVQRFIIEEDGVLLLCSDGLSDRGWVETAWSEVMEDLLQGRRSLASTTKAWIDLANQKNGHDNVSVVLLQCRVSSSPAQPVSLGSSETPSDWASSSRALLEEGEVNSEEEVSTEPETKILSRDRPSVLWLIAALIGLLLLGGSIGIAIWAQFNPTGFQQLRERILPDE